MSVECESVIVWCWCRWRRWQTSSRWWSTNPFSPVTEAGCSC